MQPLRVIQILIAVSGQLLASSQAELVVQIGHDTLKSVSFSPDGRLVLTGGDSLAMLWDAQTGHEIRPFVGHAGAVNAAAFSRDGKLILTAAEDGARVWDAATGREVNRFEAKPPAVSSAAFSPDGRQIVTGSYDGTAWLWDTVSGKEILQLKTMDRSRAYLPTSVAFSPDGKQILTGTRKTAQLWNAVTGQEIRRFEGHAYPINSVAFSPDGRFVLTGSNDRTARLWEAGTGSEIRRFEIQSRFSAGVLSVAFSPDGTKVLTGSEDQTGRLWDVKSGEQVLLLPAETNRLRLDAGGQATGYETGAGHRSAVESVAFAPDGRHLLTGERFRTAHLWDGTSGKEIRAFEGSLFGVSAISSSIAFSPDGGQLWAAGPHIWDIPAGREVRRPTNGKDRYNIALSHDGLKVALSMLDGLYLFDAAAGTPLLQFKGQTTESRATDAAAGNPLLQTLSGYSKSWRSFDTVVFSPTGSTVLTAARPLHHDEVVRLWDAASGRELVQFQGHDQELARIGGVPPDGIRSAAFSPDGSQVASSGGDKIVRLWDAATGRQIRTFESRSAPKQVGAQSDFWNLQTRIDARAVVFTPDGKRLVTCGADSAVRIWDNATGKEVQALDGRLDGHPDPCEVVVFSPDGRHMLTASEKVIRLWDPITGKETFRSAAQSARINAIAFAPRGPLIASSNADGAIRLWSLTGEQLRFVATLVSFSGGGWAAVDSEGRFDTDLLDGGAPLHWIVSDEPFRALPLEILMRQYYTPKLLPKLIAGEKLPQVPNIADLNRVQPRVEQPVIERDTNNPDYVRVRIRVARQSDGKQNSGVQDLRIFRDGRMVKFQEGPLKDGEYIFYGIRLPHEKSVEFTAYAFNSDLVKGDTARAVWERRDNQVKPASRTFMVNIGVNLNQATGCDLQYAVSDAVNLNGVLRMRLPFVTAKLLVSDEARPRDATKESIRMALAEIARQATPDDIFLMSFSGHGYTDTQGRFYIFPSDLSGSCDRFDGKSALSSAISSDELTEWLRPVDAGEMVMILDACYSAASVESGNFRPGPMGSKGLGQLSYDKRIRILTASQSTQAAEETRQLEMGLLTYSLVRDGLQFNLADWQPKDGKIWLREWLAYGVLRVPQLYKALRGGNVSEFRNANRGVKLSGHSEDQEKPSLQTPALFDFTGKENQGVLLK